MSAIALADMTAITSFAEANEVLKSKDVVQGNHVGRLGEPFVGDTLLTLHGEPHFERRRMENTLFRRELLAHYEAAFLRPALHDRLSRLRDSAAAPVHADLLALTRTVLQLIAAKVIGLDDVNDDRSVDRLRWYAEVFASAASADFATEGQDEIIARAHQAKETFIVEFFERPLQRRVELLSQLHSGKLTREQLPHDLLMMFLAHGETQDWDEELLVRETILYVIGSSSTIAQNTGHTVWLLLEWLAAHPEDWALTGTPEFLRRAANESLRVYPPPIGLIRRATADITLTTGRRISNDEYLYVDIFAANRDRSVFGEDADLFNPHRDPPERSRPFGLSFGAGPHMCIGRSLASGGFTADGAASEDEPIGVVPCLLHEFLAAGIALDDHNPPRLQENTLRHEFVEFPVTFAFPGG